MAIPASIAIPTLANDLFTNATRGLLGTCDTICIRKEDKIHLNPASNRTFVRDTTPLRFEAAVKTRVAAISEVIRREPSASAVRLLDGTIIPIVSSSTELYLAATSTAAIVRDDMSLVVWSEDARSIVQQFKAIDHALLHYINACMCKEFDTAGVVMVVSDASQGMADGGFDISSYCRGGDYYTGCESPYTPEHGLKSLPELVHLNGLRRGQRAASGDQLGLFGDQRLNNSSLSTLDTSFDMARTRSPASSYPSSSSDSSPYLSSPSPLATEATPQTVCLADISPPPPVTYMSDSEYEAPALTLDVDPYFENLNLFGETRPSSPTVDVHTTEAALTVFEPSTMTLPTVPQNESFTPSHHSRHRMTSIATTATVPSISSTARQRQAKASPSPRVSPYTLDPSKRTVKVEDPSSSEIAARRPRRRPAGPPGPSRRTKPTRPVASARATSYVSEYDEDAEAEDDDEDDNYCPSTSAHVSEGKKRRKRKRSSDAPKKVTKMACAFADAGCPLKFSREGDKMRHIEHSCSYNPERKVMDPHKEVEKLCRLCGNKQARPDALRRHIGDKHGYAKREFPEGLIEGLIAKNKIPDYVKLFWEKFEARKNAQADGVSNMLSDELDEDSAGDDD